MSRYLIVDVGAGTMDVLVYDDAAGLHYKAVAKSPVPYLAEKAEQIPGNLLVTGCEMGGGPVSQALVRRAGSAEVVMTRSAAFTIHHNPEKVLAQGIRIIEDSQAADFSDTAGFTTLEIGDLEADRLERIVEGLGVPFDFDVVGVCAQDHGMPPAGVSHLDFRHNLFKTALDKTPYPHALLYSREEVPSTFNRLRCLAESAARLPAREVYVMDSGMAAILGASMDFQAKGKQRIIVLDIATSHTVGAALENGELAGFFEYHTRDVTLERLEELLLGLGNGTLEHRRILEEGGHGAYIRKAFGFAAAELILATGPKRRLVERSRLPILPGAPLGDNMMTGTVGILEAVRRRKNLEPLVYL